MKRSAQKNRQTATGGRWLEYLFTQFFMSAGLTCNLCPSPDGYSKKLHHHAKNTYTSSHFCGRWINLRMHRHRGSTKRLQRVVHCKEFQQWPHKGIYIYINMDSTVHGAPDTSAHVSVSALTTSSTVYQVSTVIACQACTPLWRALLMWCVNGKGVALIVSW